MPTALTARGRAVRAFVVALVILGVVARFVTRSPLWLDEALSSNISALPMGDIVDALRHEAHPPLYYWMLHLWQSAFGTSDLAVRSLSGLFGVLCLPLTWVAGRRIAGPTAGWWAMCVLAITPFAVRYSTEARMYSFIMLMVLVGYLLVDDALRKPTWPRLAGVAVVTALLLWSQYWSLYLVAAAGLVLLWSAIRRPATRSATVRILLALVAGGVLFLPWVPVLLDQAAHTGTPWAAPSRPSTVLQVTLSDLGGGGWSEAYLFGTAVTLAIVIAVFGRRPEGDDGPLLLAERPDPRVSLEMGVVVLTLGIGSLAGLVTGAAFASRYTAVVVPLMIVVVGVGLALLRRGWLFVGLAGSLLLFGLVGVGKNVIDDRTQAEDVAAAIEREAGPDDVVVVCPDQLGVSLERALRGSGVDRLVPYPTAGDPRFIDWRDYKERNDAASPIAFAKEIRAEAGDATIWLAFNTTYRTFEGDCETLSRALGEGREATMLVRPSDAFEPSYLVRFR